MQHATKSRPTIESRLAHSDAAPDHSPSLSLLVTSREAEGELIRRLALDRLRELHDDGVTMDYIGRMYGVSGQRMREVEDDLRNRS